MVFCKAGSLNKKSTFVRIQRLVMKPIETLHLFEDLNQELIYFLAELSHEEWLLPSPVAGRTIKDIASHLIDGSLRRISMQRDHFQDLTDPAPAHHHELIHWVQEKNAQWIGSFRRLSSRIIVEMLKKYEQEVFELYSRLKPEDPALFPVSWAGHAVSPNWLDIARDYTEKWHHQMQMRMAAQKPLLMSERYLTPLYQTLLLGLPFHLDQQGFELRDHLLQIEITGKIRLRNRLIDSGQGWAFTDDTLQSPATIIRIPASIGWKYFTNTFKDKHNFVKDVEIQGNEQLATTVLKLSAVLS